MKEVIFLLLFSVNGYSIDTYQLIKNNKPSIDDEFASQIAYEIDAAAKKYNLPSNVLAGIAMKESSYILNAFNTDSKDYGMFQINRYNIKAYNFSIDRLMTDLKYSVEAGAIVFKWFYNKYKNLDHALAGYNCGVKPSCRNKKKVIEYVKDVKKYSNI